MIKSLPLDFLSVSHRIPRKNKNAIYCLQVSALVPEIIKFVKYANEMTDDIFYTQPNIILSNYINGAMMANLQHRSLKLGRLIIVLQEIHLWQLTLFLSPPT